MDELLHTQDWNDIQEKSLYQHTYWTQHYIFKKASSTDKFKKGDEKWK